MDRLLTCHICGLYAALEMHFAEITCANKESKSTATSVGPRETE
jgi:hypothetical protein